MKKFKLQAVLDYRQQLKKIAQHKLYEAHEEQASLAGEITRKRAELEVLHADLEKRRRAGIGQQELTIYENCRCRKIDDLTLLKKMMDDVMVKVEVRQQALCAADQQEKLLESLKEKQALQSRRLLNRNETIMLDEIAGRHCWERKNGA